MKYITTGENPVFKVNIEFHKIKDGIDCIGTFVNVNNGMHKISPMTFDEWLKKGYIKEVVEKEYTKSDMIELVRFDFNSTKWNPTEVLKEFLKQRNK